MLRREELFSNKASKHAQDCVHAHASNLLHDAHASNPRHIPDMSCAHGASMHACMHHDAFFILYHVMS